MNFASSQRESIRNSETREADATALNLLLHVSPFKESSLCAKKYVPLEDEYEFLSLEMTSKDERVSRLENSVSAKEKIVLLREERITKLEGEIGSKNRNLAANEILIAELMHQKSIPKGEAETEKARILELEHDIVPKNQDFASQGEDNSRFETSPF